MYPKDLIKFLQKNGWKKVSQNGSHVKMRKGNKTTIIAVHNKDIKSGTLNEILKQTGLK